MGQIWKVGKLDLAHGLPVENPDVDASIAILHLLCMGALKLQVQLFEVSHLNIF